MADTGYPHVDAQTDFQRQRRRQVLSRLAARLRRAPDDVSDVLHFVQDGHHRVSVDLACQRYQLMRTHRWDDEVVDRLRSARGRSDH